jgi:hypothetical protein
LHKLTECAEGVYDYLSENPYAYLDWFTGPPYFVSLILCTSVAFTDAIMYVFWHVISDGREITDPVMLGALKYLTITSVVLFLISYRGINTLLS